MLFETTANREKAAFKARLAAESAETSPSGDAGDLFTAESRTGHADGPAKAH